MEDPELRRHEEIETKLESLSESERKHDLKVTWGLLAVSVLVYVAWGVWYSGEVGAIQSILTLMIRLAILLPIGLLGCFLGARILKTNFGTFGPASLKLATLFVVSDAVALTLGNQFAITLSSLELVIPLGYLLTLVIYFWLLYWLFDLDLLDVVYFALILWVVRAAALSLANHLLMLLNYHTDLL